MSRKYFGTDGVRAVAGEFPLNASWVLKLGMAAAEVLKEEHNKKRIKVVLGKDTRQSGDMLEAALAAGLTSRGVDVVHLGILPTPAISYLSRELDAAAGIVISASHNPSRDNGIKFFGSNGKKLADAVEIAIEKRIDENFINITDDEIGVVTNYSEAERVYMNFLQHFAPDLTGLKIAIDCANGAAFRIAPKIFQSSGADVFAIYTNPDGRNINRNCGSTNIDHLRLIVAQGEHDIGIAFDGDADRVLLVDSRGNILNGDHMLYANALARDEDTIVGTLMSNMALEVKLRSLGKRFERTAVGDRYVFERLESQSLKLGGEQSGHMLFLDIAPTGDGVLTALLTLKAAQKLQKTLDEIYDELPIFPQVLKNVFVDDKKSLISSHLLQSEITKAEELLEGRGRINVRPSGTEELIRIMIEGSDKDEIEQIANHLVEIVKSIELN